MTSPQPSGVDEYAGANPQAGPSVATNFQALYGISADDLNLKVQTGMSGEPTGNVNARAAERGDADPRARTPLTQSVLAILQSLNAMSPKARQSLQAMLSKAGYLSEDYLATGHMDKDFVKAFTEMLSEYARSNDIPETNENSAGLAQRVSWQTYLTNRASDVEKAAAAEKAEPAKVRLISMTEATPAYRAAFREAVGRDPSANEIRQFVDAYNAEARANPLVTKVEMVDGVEVTSTEGGVSEDFMGTQIEENPDYANYQAVATYFPAMERVLGEVHNLNEL